MLPVTVALQDSLRVEAAEDIEQECDHSRPASLMTGSEARSIVAMEVLVEEKMVSPMGILLELLRAPVHRPAAARIPQERRGQPLFDFLGYLEECQVAAGTSRA